MWGGVGSAFYDPPTPPVGTPLEGTEIPVPFDGVKPVEKDQQKGTWDVVTPLKGTMHSNAHQNCILFSLP